MSDTTENVEPDPAATAAPTAPAEQPATPAAPAATPEPGAVEPDPGPAAPAEQPETPEPGDVGAAAEPSPWDVAHIHGLRERLHELRGRMSRDLDARRHSDGPQSPEAIDGNVARNHLTRAWDHLGAALERLGGHDGALPTGVAPAERETPEPPAEGEAP